MERQLTSADFRQVPEWLWTSCIGTSNAEGEQTNHAQVFRFGRYFGEAVVRWRRFIKKGLSVQVLDPSVINELYQENTGLWGYFVRGAPGYVNANVNPEKKIGNGTYVRFHSLVLSDSESEESRHRVQSQLDQPDGLRPPCITLEEPPHAINVEVRVKTSDWPEGQTCCLFRVDHDDGTSTVVIPMEVSRETAKVDIGFGPWGGARKVEATTHNVDVGFGVTFHKTQGKTMSKVIVDLNERRFKPPVTLSGAYVALTRVTKGDDMRIMPLHPGKNLDYLKKLKRDTELAAWLQGFNDAGVWERDRALAAWNRLKAEESGPGRGRGHQGGPGGRGRAMC